MGGMSDTWLRKPILLNPYRRYLGNQDTLAFVQAVSKSYAPSTLERLATSDDAEIRRAAVFALGFAGDYQVNHLLGRAMQDEDAGVRQLAAVACRSVWNRFGDKSQQRQLADTVRLNAARRYRDAIEIASRLLEVRPGLRRPGTNAEPPGSSWGTSPRPSTTGIRHWSTIRISSWRPSRSGMPICNCTTQSRPWKLFNARCV